MSEQREFPRYPVELDCEIIHAEHSIHGRSANLSQTGIACAVPERLEISSVVTIELALVFDERTYSEKLRLPATIVWCTPISDKFQIGAKFANLTPQLNSFLDMFARYLDT